LNSKLATLSANDGGVRLSLESEFMALLTSGMRMVRPFVYISYSL
jgi:hypothetical protein